MSDEWPFVRRNLRNTGSSSTAVPENEPELLWQHDAKARIFGTPLVVGDRVYVVTGAQSHHSIDCAVAIDRASGDRLWMTASAAMEVRGTPAVADGTLYFGDLDGQTFAIDVIEGIVNKYTDILGASPADGMSPLVYDGTVFTNRYCLEARNTDNLELRWKSDDGCAYKEPMAIADGQLFAGGFRQTGERIYVGQDDADLPSFVKESEPVFKAVDPETGVTHWETTLDGLPRAPAVVDETVYVPTYGSDPQGTRVSSIKPCEDEQPIPDEEPAEYRTFGSIHALDVRTGTERWATRLSEPARTMPAVDGRYVCFGTTGGSLVAFDAETGEQEWQRPVNDDQSVLSSPTIADDAVFVGSDNSYLLALDLLTGEELWRFESEAAVDANPSVVDEVVYFADNSGNVYAIG